MSVTVVSTQQLGRHTTDNRMSASTSSQSHISRVSLLLLLPPPLLAHIACHLRVVTLLRFQRCSSSLSRLRTSESYMLVAWRWANRRLSTDGRRLHQWALPAKQCVEMEDMENDEPVYRLFIPEAVWLAALPAFKAVLAKAATAEVGDNSERYQRLRQLVQQPQPTKWILAKPGRYTWHAVDESEERSTDVQRVEVLRDIDSSYLGREVVPRCRDVEVRSRLVLQACPYLQDLDLAIDTNAYLEPSHEDTFALVPHLRSLTLTPWNNEEKELLIEDPPIDFERMLNSLPHLTTLWCCDIYLTVSDLLDIASHSTLEQLHIHSQGRQLADAVWIGSEVRFPVCIEEDDWQLQHDTGHTMLDGDIEEEKEEDAEVALAHRSTSAAIHQLLDRHNQGNEGEPEWMKDEMRRLHTALTRTQPTRRSCALRLELADWLHRRLRRGKLHTDDRYQPAWLLRRYRQHVALVRSTLRHQLSELAQVASSAGSPSTEGEVGTDRLEQLDSLHRQLEMRKIDQQGAVEAVEDSLARLRDTRKRLMDTQSEQSAVQRTMAAIELAHMQNDLEAHMQKVTACEMAVSRLEQHFTTLEDLIDTEEATHTQQQQRRVGEQYEQKEVEEWVEWRGREQAAATGEGHNTTASDSLSSELGRPSKRARKE